jgi:hypothetical protein
MRKMNQNLPFLLLFEEKKQAKKKYRSISSSTLPWQK